MTALNACNLTIEAVEALLNLQEENGTFATLLSLDAIADFEQQELEQIKLDLRSYLQRDKASEG